MTSPNPEIRRIILDIIYNSGAAHIGSALSVVEILNAIFENINIEKIKSRDNSRERVILSKGHSAAALYAVMYRHGLLTNEQLNSYSKNGSFLGGHASHFVPYVEHSTGALGHGLAVGLGMAIGLRSKKLNSRVFVVLGDGELHEGSNWEALMQAGYRKMSNLCVLIDRNRLSQMREVIKGCDVEPLKSKLESFNFEVLEVDGHDQEEISQHIRSTRDSVRPVAIICHTTKGKGVSFMENNNLWHYRCPDREDYTRAIQELAN